MYLHLNAECLDKWLGDFGEFRYDFLRHCNLITKTVGYHFEFDQTKLQVAHQNWVAQCELWKQSYVMPDSNGLSHLKILAILLHQLACVDWIRALYEFDPARDGLENAFTGTTEQREEVRRDINAGRGTYLAFQFVIQVINWFEAARVDRRQKFVFRLNTDLEHDMMVYLLSEKREEMATFLIMKALYARDPRG